MTKPLYNCCTCDSNNERLRLSNGIMSFCPAHTLLDFDNTCVRSLWATALPGVFVFAFSVSWIPLPTWLRLCSGTLGPQFHQFLTLPDAEALDAQAATGNASAGEEDALFEATPKAASAVPLWRTLSLSWIALFEALVWFAIGSYSFIQDNAMLNIARPFVTALAWLYAAVRPVAKPQATPPFDVFVLTVVHLLVGILTLGGTIFQNRVDGIPLPPLIVLSLYAANLAAILIILTLLLAMPLAIPSSRVDKEKIVCFFIFEVIMMAEICPQGLTISPEDYTSLWSWFTFSWVWPLVKRVCIPLSP